MLGGCRGTDVVARSAYEPDLAAPSAEEFDRSSKILFKQCIVAFGEDRWDSVVADAKRLQLTGKKWGDQKANDPERLKSAERLQSACRQLEQAATSADATAVSKALGEVAEALTKLRVANPQPNPTPKKE